MALRNVVGEGLYTVVEIHQYMKHDHYIGIELVTYESDKRDTRIANFGINVEGVDTPSKQINQISKEEWQQWFGIDAISGDSNIIKQCYLYLKSRIEFKNVENS